MASPQEYEKMLAQLRASGWQEGDPIPEGLLNASNDAAVGAPLGGAGTMADPMQLSTMNVTGGPQGGAAGGDPQANPMGAPAAPLAGGGVGVFEGMSDEDAGKYAGMGELTKQRAAAEAMRDTEALKGKYVNQGRTYVADSPIAHIVRGAKIHKGKKDVKKIGEGQTEGRRSIIDLLRNRKKDEEEGMEYGADFDEESFEGYV